MAKDSVGVYQVEYGLCEIRILEKKEGDGASRLLDEEVVE